MGVEFGCTHTFGRVCIYNYCKYTDHYMLKLPTFISLGQNVTINLHRDCADEDELIDNV